MEILISGITSEYYVVVKVKTFKLKDTISFSIKIYFEKTTQFQET